MTLAVNIAAGTISRLWLAVLQILVTPIIVHLLGPSSYGLVGFSLLLTMFLGFLDQAVSPVLARELARRSAEPGGGSGARNLLRTLEVVSCSMALAIGLAVLLTAPLIAKYWLTNSDRPLAEVTTAVRLMGLWIAAQWPASLYSGGFIGLQRQDLLVAIRVGLSTVQSLGAALVLWQVSASVEIYFLWQAALSAVLSLALGLALWRVMPAAAVPPRIEPAILGDVWRFAAGNLAIGLLAATFTQAGGLITAKYSRLEDLAAYTLAFSLAAQVGTLLSQPLATSLMPHFTKLVASGDADRLRLEYHRWTQILVALILPLAGVLIVYGEPLMRLWLGASSPLVEPVARLLPWLTLGTVLNTFATPPYILQMAHGWTRLSVVKNVIAVVVVVPALLIFVPQYGPFAAAMTWIAINLGYYLIEVPVMHRRLLTAELKAWWLTDTLLPGLLVAGIFGVAAMTSGHNLSLWSSLGAATVTAMLSWAALFAVLPSVRADAVMVYRRVHQAAFAAR